jgi:TolB-like protein
MSVLYFLQLALAFASGAPSDSSKSVHGQLAVLAIENTTGSYQSFVEGMPDMIVTELVNQTDEFLVERSKVVEAMNELKMQASGLATEGNRKLGQWVGAEKVLLGSLNRFGAGIRLDLRLIDVGSGQILAAASSQSASQSAPNDLLKAALDQLVPHLRQKPTAVPAGVPLPVLARKVLDTIPWMPGRIDSGDLKIGYRTTLSLLTEQKVPFQVVRVHLDGKWLADSPVIDAVDKDFVLFRGNVAEGNHVLRLEHWICDGKGRRSSLLRNQPGAQAVTVHARESLMVEYRMKVQVVGFGFQEMRVQ